jgi:DNA helicase HerA-like ATPase
MASLKDTFTEKVTTAHRFKGDSILLGGGMLDGQVLPETHVKLPLKMMNRHGLIAGATGSGKTKTLQILAEQLANNGVPSLLMDIKGDLSGISMPAESNPKIEERHQKIGEPFVSSHSTVEFLSLSDEPGVRLRATVSEFGPVLFSKILGLNDTQGGVVALIFKYCDDHDMPLLDLQDFRRVTQYLNGEGKAELENEYGMISSASIGAILRKIVELEQQGAELFFGEPSFEVEDLVRVDDRGRGIVSVLRLTDLQDRPKLFSTFMLQLLAEIYATFPEQGDADRPKLAIFIDEAHLIFSEASKALLSQIESIIKLIRSKGVGVYFVTQDPTDVPEAVLAQLGLKIQHALRAFTAKDRRNIKLVSENFPITEFYKTDELLTQLGIGEALVTTLNEKGIPTPLVHTMLRAPQSRMDVLTSNEIDGIIRSSRIMDKYSKTIDRESAHEIITQKLQAAHEEKQRAEMQAQWEKARLEEERARQKTSSRSTGSRSRQAPNPLDSVLGTGASRTIGNTVAREITRGLLGVLGLGGTTRRKKGWF